MSVIADSMRLLWAAVAVLAYIAMCAAIFGVHRRPRRAGASAGGDGAAWIVAFASQTGSAEELAALAADTLRIAGVPVRLCALQDLDRDTLAGAERALFIVSTYGEGDAPDNGARFASDAMTGNAALHGLHYALLALGDSSYANFCGFGRALDAWLGAQGAQSLFQRIEVDRHDAAALDEWRQRLSHLAGTSDAPDWSGPPFSRWRLVERRLLNPGSAGAPIYHLELTPQDGPLPAWESGDLAQIQVPHDPQRPRDYSIASIPADGRLHLLLRLHRHPDGSTGLASGWLTQDAAIGDTVPLRLRRHPRFGLGDNMQRPLIFIGNGSGMAGLRGHLKARAAAGARPNWLLFGERNAATDFHYRDEIDAWLQSGLLERADMVFSRDGARHRYVQEHLLAAGDMVRAWVEQGAAIYVCGSLNGMAAGVDAALVQLLGQGGLERLSTEGRYRRDVY